MRKVIKIVLAIALVVIVGRMVLFIANKLQSKKEIATRLQMLPDVKGVDVSDAWKFNTRLLEDADYYILLFFNTDCEHCHYEVEQISVNYELFKTSQVVFFSVDPIDSIKNFVIKYNLNVHPNFHIIKCKSAELRARFGKLPAPTLFIYDRNKELLKRFDGEVKIKAIEKYITM